MFEVDGSEVAPAIDRFKVAGLVILDPDHTSDWRANVQLQVISLPEDDGVAVVRVTVQPMIAWLWVGGILMAVGTALSAFPGKRRRGTEAVSAVPGVVSVGAAP